jgi:hypothetical protein
LIYHAIEWHGNLNTVMGKWGGEERKRGVDLGGFSTLLQKLSI